jgi:hypothetical protein
MPHKHVLYSLHDLHIPIPKIEEVMKFQKELTDKKTLEKFQSLEDLILFSSVLTFETKSY